MKRALALCLLCWLGCGGVIDLTAGTPSGAPGGSASAAARAASPAAPAPAPADCSQVQTGPRRLWRLTATQYDNTIRDLFGIESTFGAGFPADEVHNGFANNADALMVTPLLADKLQAAALDIAARAELSRLAPCAAGVPSDADGCLHQLASGFGERLFRRALSQVELDRYLKLAQSAGGFEPGARLMLLAFLQSPNFLYRSELGAHASGKRFVLSDYELASELSYLLWQTTPDQPLLAAARAGQLHEPAQVQAQVDRLLADPRARAVVRAFVFEWLGLSQVSIVPKDMARFPELTPRMRSALLAEAERFVDYVMFDRGGSLSELLRSPVTFLDWELATFYGLPPTADPSQPVMLPGQERVGILTLGATMLAHARSNDSSPVHRGKLVRERLLCQPLPPPPPGIVVQPPPLDPNKTTRERYAAHSSVEPCAGCHRLMDPIGLAFEHFDGIGRYRADDNGLPIDVHGEILASAHTDGSFDGVAQLVDKLEQSPDVAQCYARSWLRFGYGLSERGDGGCVVQQVQRALADDAGSLAAIFGVLTQTEQFYARSGEPEPSVSEAPAPQPSAPAASGAEELPPGLAMDLSVNNDWGAGYCKTYALKNSGSAPITWSISLTVEGTLNNHWECEISAERGTIVFTGAEHNRSLPPGGQAQFGFCAVR